MRFHLLRSTLFFSFNFFLYFMQSRCCRTIKFNLFFYVFDRRSSSDWKCCRRFGDGEVGALASLRTRSCQYQEVPISSSNVRSRDPDDFHQLDLSICLGSLKNSFLSFGSDTSGLQCVHQPLRELSRSGQRTDFWVHLNFNVSDNFRHCLFYTGLTLGGHVTFIIQGASCNTFFSLNQSDSIHVKLITLKKRL